MDIKDNNKVKSFLDTTISKVKNKDMHLEIREELLNHIEDKFYFYISLGLDENSALEKSLLEMGSSEDIGEELNLVHKKKLDVFLMALVISLAVACLTILFSISKISTDAFNLKSFYNSIFAYSLGFLVLYITYRFLNIKFLYKYSNAIYYISLFCLFLNLFNYNLYLSIVPKPMITILLIIPLLISINGILIEKPSATFRLIIPLAFILNLNSLSGLIIYLVCIFVLVFKRGSKLNFLGFSFSIFIFGFYVLFKNNYLIYRLTSLLSFSNPESSGYYIYSLTKDVLSNSNLIGQATNIDLSSIPLINSELIFTYIIGRFGYIPFAILISLITILLVKVFKYIRSIKNSYGKSIVLTAFTMLSCNFALTLLCNLGFSPLLNTISPFLSSSKVSIFSNMFLIGLILNIYSNRSITDISFNNIDKKSLNFSIKL
ncbi:MAG: FtsW/RodA/SpoVE family cell cycle protein [Clostridium sp.]|uniref:FtsW/RodA/SpoVE family cell cycle protein n=2 Tax=Clostridium TaxID=1485 RepID=UPI0021527B39|nr:FtsW/RodA/SpoVE family cell cycle protein [Clostridium sp. LY3-2]MCR6514936.1 FtsW/RodA/SpoVE family cell cycle protein [Clostridium sp. LY3-2]